MSSTRTVCTRQNLKAEDWDTLGLEDVLSKNRRAKWEAQKAKTGKPAGPKGRDPAIFLGDVAWHSQFPANEIELNDTSFMDQLEKELTEAQVKRLNKDINEALSDIKEEFCKGDFT